MKKADLSLGYWNPETKLGVAEHFFRDNYATIIILKSSKIQSNVWHLFSKLKLYYL